MFLLASYPLVIMVMAWVFFGMVSPASYFGAGNSGISAAQNVDFTSNANAGLQQYWLIILAAVGTWFVIAWLFHQSMINASTNSRPVSRKEMPRIYNMMENLCIAAGMTMPKLQVIETSALNAFASGLSESSFSVTLTTGIIDKLTDDELEAVIGHELSHIRHRDVRLLVIGVIFVGMISFVSNMMFRSMLWGRGDSRRQGQSGGVLIIAMIALGVGYVASILVRFALSRKREFMADAGSVELTKSPDNMIAALRKISGRADMPKLSDNIKEMCIENAAGFMGGLFATHPPIEKRIAALVAIGGHDAGKASYSANTNHHITNNSDFNVVNEKYFYRRHGPWG